MHIISVMQLLNTFPLHFTEAGLQKFHHDDWDTGRDEILRAHSQPELCSEFQNSSIQAIAHLLLLPLNPLAPEFYS